MTNLLHKNEVYTIVGAAMEVYNVFGPGLLEAVYQESLKHELAARGIPFAAQKGLSICYKHIRLSKSYIADLLVSNRIIVEIKALDLLTTREDAQLLDYLNATRLQVGVLLNFGASGKLQWRRMERTAR